MTTAPRLLKRQSLSTATVLFRTTFTRTIKLNLLLDLFKLVISFVLGSFKWTAEMKSHLPLLLVFQYINFTVNLRIYFSVFLLFFFLQTHLVALQQPQDFCSTDFLVFCVLFFFGILLINKFLLFMFFFIWNTFHIKKKQHFFTGHYLF